MQNFLFLILWNFLITSTSTTKTERIAGGKVAKIDQFPFFAQLQTIQSYNFTHSLASTCGASLIRPQWIITAAHCLAFSNLPSILLERNRYVKVYMGTNKRMGSDGVVTSVKKIHLHPNYIGEIDPLGFVIRLQNDIAVAELWSPYILNKHIQVISLPEPGRKRCKVGKIIGTGYMKMIPPVFSEHVLYAEVESLNISELNDALIKPRQKTIFYSEVQWMKGHTLRGDSGGPYACFWNNTAVLYGIVSTGRKTWYGSEISTYEDVSKYLNFIFRQRSSSSVCIGLDILVFIFVILLRKVK